MSATEFITKPAEIAGRNKHVSGAVAVMVIAEFALPAVMRIWMPEHEAQIVDTQRLIHKCALWYGMLALGWKKPAG